MKDQEKKDLATASGKMEGQFAASISRKPIKCPQCGAMNQGTRKNCKKCNAEFPAH